MDAILILLCALLLALRVTDEELGETEQIALEVRMNPERVHDEKAFLEVLNVITLK